MWTARYTNACRISLILILLNINTNIFTPHQKHGWNNKIKNCFYTGQRFNAMPPFSSWLNDKIKIKTRTTHEKSIKYYNILLWPLQMHEQCYGNDNKARISITISCSPFGFLSYHTLSGAQIANSNVKNTIKQIRQFLFFFECDKNSLKFEYLNHLTHDLWKYFDCDSVRIMQNIHSSVPWNFINYFSFNFYESNNTSKNLQNKITGNCMQFRYDRTIKTRQL